MAINPLSNSLANILGSRPATTAAPGADGARARVQQGATTPTATSPAATRAGAASIAQPAQSSLPVAAPPGTDPELWSVLTGEERAFFARVGSMGPLTYGRLSAAQSAPPAARGVRLDVKV